MSLVALISMVAPDSLSEIFANFCKLKGYTVPKPPIEKMIDEATGIWDERLREFEEFLEDVVMRAITSNANEVTE